MQRYNQLFAVLICCTFFLLFTAQRASAVEAAKPDPVDFDSQIKPLLSDRCFVCHGPDKAARKADLRLDLEDDAKDYAIIPGEPGDSEVVTRIKSDKPKLQMPPPSSNLSLSKEEIALIERWIEEGANWNEHWSFTPLAKVKPPQIDAAKLPPETQPLTGIDRFVVRGLQKKGHTLGKPVSKERWLRRVTFDLTGLPPTLAELDAFLADDSSDAYEKTVDRLLASPRFGERLASDWLDSARYSDTYGYQVDRDRYVWPWRDWVVRAFNSNTRYDRFLTQQLAGDLLPDATRDDILATTFNRLHPQKVEGGSVPEEFRIEYVADRTQTVATAMLGLTMECCRCHDHKYDPLPQKDYYRFSAFFDNVDEAGLYSYFTPSIPTPTLMMTDDATDKKLASLRKDISSAEAILSQLQLNRKVAFNDWLATKPSKDLTNIGRVAHLDFEDHKDGANVGVKGQLGKAVKLSGDDAVNLKVGNFPRWQPFSVSLWMNTPDEKERAVIFHRSRAWTDAGSRGYELLLEDGRLSAALIHFYPGNAIRVRTVEPISSEAWHHVAVTYDGSSRANGLRIYLNGELAQTEVVRDNLYKQITGGGGDNIAIGQRFRDRGFTGGVVDEFQVFQRELTALEVAESHKPGSLVDAIAAVGKDTENAELYDFYLSNLDADYQAELASLQKLRQQLNQTQDRVQEIMVMKEMPKRRQTYLLNRGSYDARGEAVEPGVPGVLPEFAADQPMNRLGLARWLTQPEHPLTSRVAVNRFWQLVFGAGLVRTPEDFGRQGQAPTDPQLLDWLAADFVAHGWDVKRLMKQLVLSATYRQSSYADAKLLAADPENLLWGRMNSYRLPAEMVRDNALAVSGLLVERIGGPPVKPYELEASFKPAKRDKGDGLYRRSLYTYWKRTGPAPVMMALDAAKRDVCRVQRERTSTPLQVFVLLNGPQFVEASRFLAQRMLNMHPDDTQAALRDTFRSLTSRQPNDAELKVLTKLHDQQLATFKKHPERATEYLRIGDKPFDTKLPPAELAALATVANTLLSFDEAITKK